jgi:HEAT repeat protein
MNRNIILSLSILLSISASESTLTATSDRHQIKRSSTNILDRHQRLASRDGPRFEETFNCRQLQPFILDADPNICATDEKLQQMSESARSAILKLLPLLQHPHPAVRASTLEVLSYRGASVRSAIPKFIDLLQDPDSNVVEAARSTLAKLGYALPPKSNLPPKKST